MTGPSDGRATDNDVVQGRALQRCFTMAAFIYKYKHGFEPICLYLTNFRAGSHRSRTGEMAHPFTTCSSHDVFVTGQGSKGDSNVRQSLGNPQRTKMYRNAS